MSDQRERVRAILEVRSRVRNVLALVRGGAESGQLGTPEHQAKVTAAVYAFFASVDGGVGGRLLPEPDELVLEKLQSAQERVRRAIEEQVRGLAELVDVIDAMAATELRKLGEEGGARG